MCFSSPSPPPAPPVAPPPMRADEENRQAVDQQLMALRQRQGRSSTFMGSTADYGSNVQGVTLLGQAGKN